MTMLIFFDILIMFEAVKKYGRYMMEVSIDTVNKGSELNSMPRLKSFRSFHFHTLIRGLVLNVQQRDDYCLNFFDPLS